MLNRLIVILTVFTLLTPGFVSAAAAETAGGPQGDERTPGTPAKVEGGHHEAPQDGYVPVDRNQQARSPAYTRLEEDFFTIQVNVDENGDNIVGDAANEPSLAVDPTNPNRIVIGWRQFDTISSNFRQAGWAYTANGGTSWTFPGKIEAGVFRSDPVLDADSQGNFYYNSLTTNDYDYWCHVFKSTDGGATWDDGTYAYGGDKQWQAIDRTGGPGDGNIYAFWTSFYSTCYPGFFTRSSDDGASFENCITIPGSPYWGTLDVDLDGALYVVGDGFALAKSSNAWNGSQSLSWDFSTTVDLDGYLAGYGTPNPGGLLGQAWVAVDRSSGSTQGNVYVLASVTPSGSPDPQDVMFARSTDGGSSWSSPVIVNDDESTSHWQWFGTMSVAPNGRIDVIWLDTRDNPGSVNSSLYYSYSEDAGVTWSENQRLTDAFDPRVGWPQQNKMGDYFDMISTNAACHIAYAATFNGEQDVYYGRVSHGASALGRLVAGPGPGPANPPTVRVFPPVADATPEHEFDAYGAPYFGVNVACGDVTGDGLADIITGPGPGTMYGPHVRGFQVDGTPMTGLSFMAYGTLKYGVNVAAGNVAGSGADEIITGAGPGNVFGPHVRGWSYNGSSASPLSGVSYFAYGTPKFGVNVAAGDIDADGWDEIVSGAGPGAVYGPHVRGWNVDGGTAAPMSDVSFMAYGTFKFGVVVSCGDVDGDGVDEIITTPGPGAVFGAHVHGWNYDGDEVTPLPGFSFFAWPETVAHYGACADAGADMDGDGRAEVVVGGGPDPNLGSEVKVYRYNGSTVELWFSLDAFPAGYTHGTKVAAGMF